jgi:phospholipid/cholesterol/gamma-HCH transport system substrate-binding protein
MKTLSNEAKVGIIAILTIIVFIWVFNFLLGKNLFKSTATYYAVYDKVGGLAESSPVEVNGYRVGVVQSLNFIDAVSGKLLVEFSVDKNFKIPKNSVAEIIPVSVLGGMKVQFVYGNGPGFYENEDTIPARLAASFTDMIETELIPIKDKIADLVSEIDSVMTSVNDVMNEDFKKDLGKTMSNLRNTTGSLDNVLASKEMQLKETLDNLNTFTRMLSENSGKMSETFTSLQSITDTLAAADIYSTVNNLKSSLQNTALMIDNMNNGKGSAGQFLTNDSLYTNLSQSLQNLNVLLKDLKANPKRYVHFSVFGKKEKPAE